MEKMNNIIEFKSKKQQNKGYDIYEFSWGSAIYNLESDRWETLFFKGNEYANEIFDNIALDDNGIYFI